VPKVFTDISIQKLPEGLHFDGKLPSFGLRVGKNRRTWLVIKGEKRAKIRLGHYPALSLADARKRAMVTLGSPMEPAPAQPFPDALAAFLAQGKWRPRSKTVLESSLRHFNWKRPIDKITHEDVVTALDAIGGKSARAHALKDIRSFFNWTIPRYLKNSPCQGIKMHSQPSRARVLTDAELKAVWNAAKSMGRYGYIVQVLILTGQRRGEIASIQSDMILAESATLPGWLTKNKREHSFPITPLMRELLIKCMEPEPFDWQRSKIKLDKASGVGNWTLHDLRRTCATGLAAIGVQIHVTERLLNHVSGALSGVALVYNRHSYWTDLVAAVQAWQKKVESIVDG
jgi:integrase